MEKKINPLQPFFFHTHSLSLMLHILNHIMFTIYVRVCGGDSYCVIICVISCALAEYVPSVMKSSSRYLRVNVG